MEFFLDPRMLPYSVALVVFFIFVFIEVVSLLIGIGIFDFLNNIEFEADIDLDIDSDIPTAEVDNSFTIGSFFGYINPKRVPFSMLLMVFFFLFSFYGALIQENFGFMAIWITLPIVTVITVFSIRYVSSLLSFIIPKIESEAVSVESFIGFEATILDPKSKRDLPARASLVDPYHNKHYIRVEPLEDNEEYKEGDRVVVIKKSKNSNIFFVDISIWNSMHNRKISLD